MKLSKDYSTYLKGEFYKCLCLFEEQNEGLTAFISTFSYEVYGLQYKNVNLTTLDTITNILEHFYDDSLASDYNINTIRRECFHCISLVDKLLKAGAHG